MLHISPHGNRWICPWSTPSSMQPETRVVRFIRSARRPAMRENRAPEVKKTMATMPDGSHGNIISVSGCNLQPLDNLGYASNGSNVFFGTSRNYHQTPKPSDYSCMIRHVGKSCTLVYSSYPHWHFYQ